MHRGSAGGVTGQEAATLSLPAAPESARRARLFLAEYCRGNGLPPSFTDCASLLVSELVTNAVLHGRTTTTVEIHRQPATLRVVVRDESTTPSEATAASGPADIGGRGLQIVAGLASRWGVELAPGGKAVWFELSIPPPRPHGGTASA